MGLPNKNDGTPMTAELGVGGAIIPKGAKAVDVAKDFMKYVIQPQVTNNYLKEGLGRWLPAVPSLVKSDPFWLNGDPQVKAYVTEGLLNDTVPNYPAFNPGWAEVNAQQIWGSAEADVIRNGTDPKTATETAFKKIEAIVGKYPIAQS